MPSGMFYRFEAEGRIAAARGEAAAAAEWFAKADEDAAAHGYHLAALRARSLRAAALVAAGEDAAPLLARVATEAAERGAALVLADTRRTADAYGIALDVPERAEPEATEATTVPLGERMVTTMFADVRGYTEMTSATPAPEMADRLGALHRWAKAAVERHQGIVDKFAGDAVMATFNVSGASVDHALHAVQAALVLRDKAWLAEVPVGIGIAVGPAVVGRAVAGANITVAGVATNLAARLQAAAEAGEILLSEEAYRRVASWLEGNGLDAGRETIDLKGFDAPQTAYRLPRVEPA